MAEDGGGPFRAEQVSDGRPSKVERWDEYATLGEEFLAQLPVDRNCVILTIVPTVETKRAEAMAIAQNSGTICWRRRSMTCARSMAPTSMRQVAERWSAAFLRGAEPRIRKCVDAAQASTG